MKKILTLLVMVTMILGTVSTALAEDEVNLTFAIWDTNQAPGMQAIIDAYTAKNPNVKIDLNPIPWSEYWTKLEASAMGGVMPDIFWMHAAHVVKYITAGKMLDLTPLNYDYSVYPEGVTNLYMYEGAHYAIPKDYDTIALAYNKEIFDAAGVAYPDDTWDWAKLREVAIQLTDAEKGIYGFLAPNDTQQGYWSLIYQNGGYIVKDGVSGFNLPETQEAIQFWVDLMKVDKVSPSIESFVDTNAHQQFQAGKAAMTFVGSWMMSSYTNNEIIKDKFDLAVLPKNKVRATIYNGISYAGAYNTKYPDAVLDFLAFAGSEEGNILQAKAKAAIPAYRGTEHYFTDNFPDYNISCFVEMIDYGVQSPFTHNKSYWETREPEMMTYIYSGEKTVEEACLWMHDIITEIEGN